MRLRLYAISVLWLGVFQSLSATPPKKMSVLLERKGSAPNAGGLYSCILKLDGQEYSKERVQQCLQSILETHYFERGRTKVKELRDTISVVFVLEARRLRINKLEIRNDPHDSLALREWLKNKDPDILHLGDVYEPVREGWTKFGVESYYLYLGRDVGISTTVYLDSRAGTAQMTIEVTEGPRRLKPPSIPPYGPLCPDPVAALDWSRVDSQVPLSLVQHLVTLRDLGTCFSEEAVQADRASLEKFGIFDYIDISFTAPPASRQVSLGLKARPLNIKGITIREYGLAGQGKHEAGEELPLKKGQKYESKDSRATVTFLENKYAHPGRTVRVVEDSELTDTRELELTYNVLSFEADRVFVDGKPITYKTQ